MICAQIFMSFFNIIKISNEGITIIEVNIKNIPQSPLSQSTKLPDDDANVVLPAVPIDARAYCVVLLYNFYQPEVR